MPSINQYEDVLALNPDVQDSCQEAGVGIDSVVMELARSHARMGTPIEELMVDGVDYSGVLPEEEEYRSADDPMFDEAPCPMEHGAGGGDPDDGWL